MTGVQTCALPILAEYDWVLTTPSVAGKDIDLLRAIDWRRVITDEAHALVGTFASKVEGVKRTAVQRQTEYMRELHTIPARAYWSLTGTPVSNTKQIDNLDRCFNFIGTGVSTHHHLRNLHMAWVLAKVAIRFTKDGQLKVRRDPCLFFQNELIYLLGTLIL